MTRARALEFRKKIEKAATYLPDKDALESIELFDEWSKDKNYDIGERCQDLGVLYRCYNPIQANPTYRPSVTPAHWIVVTVGEDGTLDNPITADVGMRYYKGLYYAEEDKLYLCTRDDTGNGTILHYLPSQLVGVFFEEVTT